MQYFKAPEFNLGMAWVADASLPLLLKTYQNIEDVVIGPEDRRMLRSLRKDRLLFFTNHPSQAEPLIAYQVSRVMGSRFNFMATRRAFDFMFGIVGKVFQSVGAYSIIPGIADRDSMRMTRQILCKPAGKLILFPEGEPMCGENDSLMPFQSGIIKLSFAALGDAQKKESGADITILPGFIRYIVKASREEVLEDLTQAIQRIEHHLGVRAGHRNLLRQFLMVGRLLLEQAEKEYDIDVPEDKVEDFDFRIGRVRHRILDNIWRHLEIPHYNKDADAIHKLRHLSAIIEMVEIGYPIKEMPTISKSNLHWANRELVKAYDFVVIKRDYLTSHPTPERFYEWLARFESLVLGKKPRALGGEPSPLPRRAYVFFAEPFKLSEFYAAYRDHKSKTVKKLIERLTIDMQALLDESLPMTYNLVPAGDLGDI